MDEPCDEHYKWGHKRDRVALMLGTWGTLLTQTGEIMGMAGSSLKDKAVTDEDTVVQRLKLTIRLEGLHDQTYFTAFILSNFWLPCCCPCSPGKFFAQQQLSWWWKGYTVVILIQCGCDMKCEAASDHDMNPSLSGPCLPLWPHLHVGKILSWYALIVSAIPVDRRLKCTTLFAKYSWTILPECPLHLPQFTPKSPQHFLRSIN